MLSNRVIFSPNIDKENVILINIPIMKPATDLTLR